MSHTYKAGFASDSELREEVARLERALNDAQPDYALQVLHAEPARLRAGMLIFADGTDFDPGSGEGLYRRNAANNAWTFIG